MTMQLPSSSSSSSNGFSFDVFISFRGIDTRHGFTGHLYKALTDKGINTFIDDKELPRGDKITHSLLKSIEDSRIALIVFSKDYATSSFCLDELVHIIHCSNEKGTTVIPIFYGTEPSHVRKLDDSYGIALAKHEEGFQNNEEKMERLQKWKIALEDAANLSGHHISHGNEYERDFIEKIVTDVSNKINHAPLHVADYLVGLKSRISKVNSLLELGSNDGVCMIGILGTGGMGKTTLSQAVYNSIVHQFKFKCFLHNVRENSVKHGLEYLQEQILSKSIGFETKFGHVNEGIPIIKRRLYQKKVLLILDDVDKIKQLQVLIGEASWLGRGSRVIITTRDKQLLSGHGIRSIYEADGLNKEESLELLRTKAFKSKKNDSSYDYILKRAVKYASGLPLALEVVGSNLYDKSIAECESLLDKYERIPHEDIQKILKVSYDALDEEQQSVFLDIACVFKGHPEKYVQEVLRDHYGYSIKSHLRELVDKSLIKISTQHYWESHDSVILHDLIEDMGEEIVRQESIKEPGERSRLWRPNDIAHVLKNNKGTSKIEMIYLNSSSMEPVDMNEQAFQKMTKLKTLIIQDGNFSNGPAYLPSSLVLCKWIGCPSKSLSFLSNKNFENMKNLILDWSQSLIHIPNVSSLQNLIKFSFENCQNLIKIDNSNWKLNKLEHVSAKGCLKLESFPPLHLPSLKELELSKCDSLKSFPELLCQMTNIKKIGFSDTSIGILPFSLPFSFQCLSELEYLQVNRVRMLRFPKYNDRMKPIVFSKMYSVILGETNLSDECLPILLKWFVNVTSLNLMKNNFKIIPGCLSECHLLRNLSVEGCMYLEEIRGFPPKLGKFSAVECVSLSLESRKRLLSQDLHDAGCTEISFPNGSERIPDWFEHQSRGDTISFWFSKKIPTITCIFLIPGSVELPEFQLFLNDREITLIDCLFFYDPVLPSKHAFLFDMKLHDHIYESFANDSEWYEAVKNNEWNHVELKWEKDYLYLSEDAFGNPTYTHLVPNGIEILDSAQMGIHVSWYGSDFSDTEEDDHVSDLEEDDFSYPDKKKSNKQGEVRFTNPYRKINFYKKKNPYRKRNKSRLSQKQRAEILQRRSLENTKSDEDKSLEVSEKESLQQKDLVFLSSGMHNLVPTEAKEKHRFVEVGVSETETAQRCSLEESRSDEDESLEISETETVQRQRLDDTKSEIVQRQNLSEAVSETEHGRCDVHCMTLLFELINSLFAR